MAGIEWAVILVGVLFYLFHKTLYDVCTKFGPAKGMGEPPSGIGQDDHHMQCVQTHGHVPDVKHPVPPSGPDSMAGAGEVQSPPNGAMATSSGQRDL